jgi:hypothetical protein
MTGNTDSTAKYQPPNVLTVEIGKASSSRGIARLLISGYVQVLLVAVNVYQISHGHYIGALIVGFLISLVWTFNVKSIALGTWTDRIAYSLAAAAGTMTGMALPQLFY